MNKKISLRTGTLTGMAIVLYILLLQKIEPNLRSNLVLFQFLFLLIGILISCFLLYRFYAGISLMEALTHCFKTVAATLVVVLIGNTLFYFLFSPSGQPFSNLTWIIMKNVFAYSLSGLLSSFFSSMIFHTFTKK